MFIDLVDFMWYVNTLLSLKSGDLYGTVEQVWFCEISCSVAIAINMSQLCICEDERKGFVQKKMNKNARIKITVEFKVVT